jgi:hypothetical protein
MRGTSPRMTARVWGPAVTRYLAATNKRNGGHCGPRRSLRVVGATHPICIHTDLVWVWCNMVSKHLPRPWGGYKQSGQV